MRHTVLLALMLLVLVPACGGSGSGGDTLSVPETRIDIASDAPRSGTIENDGGVHTVVPSNADLVVVGSTQRFAPFELFGHNVEVRGFYAFPLDLIPAGTTIVRATLRSSQLSVLGTPYVKLGGAILVDHIDLGPALDSADFASAALPTGLGALSTNDTVEPKSLDVTAAVQADVDSGRPRSSFRLQFGVWDVGLPTRDVVLLNNETDSSASDLPTPTLDVTYR